MAPKIINYPLDLGETGGAYGLAGISGALTAVGAAGAVFSLRWTDPAHLFLLARFAWQWFLTTAFGAAQVVDHELVIARGFTASDTGGTALLPTGNEAKVLTRMPTTKLTDARISTTGALGAGTRTLDTRGKTGRGAWAGAVGANCSFEYNWEPTRTWPVLLAANEGLVLRSPTAMGATGVIKLYVEVEWLEVPAEMILGRYGD